MFARLAMENAVGVHYSGSGDCDCVGWSLFTTNCVLL